MVASVPQGGSVLSTRRGQLTLVLLCLVAFLDFADSSIVTIAQPSIRADLHVSIENLQWVTSGYVLTYGGFLLLGGRLSDLLGRRRLLVLSTSLFASASVLCGLAPNLDILVSARLLQGLGAAVMTPAALSVLTTTFSRGTDRLKALGAWGAVSGLAAILGVLLGGVLTAGPGWRWVFFVNVPVCAIVVTVVYRLFEDDAHRARAAQFDIPGAVLITTSMLSLIFSLVQAPTIGWTTAQTLAGLVLAAVLLTGFVVNERCHAHPLVPFAIFRIKGLAAADATQVLAIAGFGSMSFFVTLYMQDVLHLSAIQAGAGYVPAAVAVVIAAGVCSKLVVHVGTRPSIVAGALLSAGALFWLSRMSVDGSYGTTLLPGMTLVGFGLGTLLVGVQTAGNASVPAEQAGLAAALVNSAFQLGVALGLAICTAIATAHTATLQAQHVDAPAALTSGFRYALLASTAFLLAAALTATRASNTRGEAEADTTALIAPLSSVESAEPAAPLP